MKFRTKVMIVIALILGTQAIVVSAGVSRGMSVVETYHCAQEEAMQIANGVNLFKSKCKELQ